MKKITTIFTMALLAGFSWQGIAQNGGDDCASAVVAAPGTFTDTTITDTTPGNNNGDAAWFSYTASGDGTITVDSGIDPDEPDTRVFILDNCTDLTVLDSDDDGGPGFTSVITDFAVTSGTNYIIQWDDRWGIGPFDWALTFTPAPTGDTCAEALPVDPGTFLEVMINDLTPGTNNGDALWYSYTAASNGAITLNSGIDLDEPDTRVKIYDNCTDLNELAGDDDSGPGFTSTLSDFAVTAGTTYIIAWDDRWSVGPFDWELVFASCVDPTDFAVTAGQTDAVFTWTDNAAATNGYTVNVFADGADPDVDAPLFTEVAGVGVITVTVAGLTELTPYDAYIISDCDGAGMSTGDAMVNFTTSGAQGPNATCDTALVVTPGVYVGMIVDAAPGNNNGDSLWYSFTPPSDGTMTVTSCLGGDNDDTRVFVSAGPCDALTPVADDDDGCDAPDGFSSLIEDIVVTGGTEYFIQWDDRWSTDEFDWELIFNGMGPDCNVVTNIVVSNVLDVSADVSWDDDATALEGYQVVVFDAGTDDAAYVSPIIPQGTAMDTATGLVPETAYEARVTTICVLGDPNVLAFSERFPFTTTALGIEDSALVSYTIFPNPATNSINLKAAYSIENIVVSNVIGQQVLANKGGSAELTLDIANLQVGTYFMKATVNGVDVVERFIKK